MSRTPKTESDGHDRQSAVPLPFTATHSQRRILTELLSTGELRETGFAGRVASADFLRAQMISNSAQLIEFLQHELFPQEMQLRARREERLQTLQGRAMRVHYDQSLETPTLIVQARIHTQADFQDTLQRLQDFGFAEWQRQCDQERADED